MNSSHGVASYHNASAIDFLDVLEEKVIDTEDMKFVESIAGTITVPVWMQLLESPRDDETEKNKCG